MPGVQPLLQTLQVPPLPCCLAVQREIRGSALVRRVYDFLARAIPLQLDIDDAAHILAPQPVEQQNLVHAIEEFRPEIRPHHRHHLIADGFRILALLLVDQIFGAEI